MDTIGALEARTIGAGHSGSFVRDLAAWAAGLADPLPADLARAAKAAILDTLAVTIAGAAEPAARIAAETVRADMAAAPASLLGTTSRASVEGAAFANGIAAHVLDYDDVSFALGGHPSVTVLPAALAVAEAEGLSGRDLLLAYVAGIEVFAKVARALGETHYTVGWHKTATVGPLAAAVAAGRLLRLDPDRLAHAVALACSTAGGLRQNFGAMAKAFHVGNAGRAGVNAARLAAAGMTGDAAILEGPLGYFAVFGHGGARPASLPAALGQPFELVSPGLSVKRYPCCYGTHRAIDGLLELTGHRALDPARVAGVAVLAPAGELEPLRPAWPRTGLEGKFSLAYCLAAALVDGDVGLGTFADAMVRRPDIERLLPLVDIRPFPAAPGRSEAGASGVVRVTLALRGSAPSTVEVRYARGAPERPLSFDELVAKCRDCAGSGAAQGALDEVIGAVLELEGVKDVRTLVDRLCGRAVAIR